jgi:hypothetical protein
MFFAAEALTFFFGTALLTGRLFSLEDVEGLLFLVTASFFAGAPFLAFGEAVILPGRLGFLEGAFLALVARIF